MPSIKVSEKISGSSERNEFILDLPSSELTVQELIRTSVYLQVELLNSGAKKTSLFSSVEEDELNHGADNSRKRLEPEKQFLMACDAFLANKVLLLFDGTQETDLNKVITIRPDSHVQFLRLVPLAGG